MPRPIQKVFPSWFRNKIISSNTGNESADLDPPIDQEIGFNFSHTRQFNCFQLIRIHIISIYLADALIVASHIYGISGNDLNQSKYQ